MKRRDVAIILGSRFPALGVIACLKPLEIRCVVCDTRRLHAGWSRHASFRKIPDPQRDPEACAEQIAAIVRDVRGPGRAVVIPTDDVFVRLLARHRDAFPDTAAICAADADVVDLLTDKRAFADWASDRGLSVPRTISADGAMTLRYPVIAKPLNYTALVRNADKLPPGVRPSDLRFNLFRNPEAWESFTRRFAPVLGQLVVQEFVDGTSADMYSIGLYADGNSEIRGLFTGRKLRGFPAQYGNTILGQNDVVPNEILAEVAHIVRELRYRGIAEIEYLRERETDRFVLIEMNPRCWSWIAATRLSPANIPALAFRDLVGEPTETRIFNESPGEIKSVRLLSDALNVFWRYRSDDPAWLMTPVAWWRSLRAERRLFVEFQHFDPVVSLFCALHAMRDLVRDER
jgi:D-aspartate ligase